jgi:hypothetical protein
MEMAECFKRVACYVKEHDGLVLLKFKFVGINKLTDLYLIYVAAVKGEKISFQKHTIP